MSKTSEFNKSETRRGGKTSARLVVLLPPLLIPSPWMLPLAWSLHRSGFRTTIFRYASWRRDIPDNAARLAAFLRATGEKEIDAVAFSMGGILLRWAATHHQIPRIGRVVMLGPPNRGAFMAGWLWRKLGPLYPLVWGKAAMQLRPGDAGLCERAGELPPGTGLGIVAGGRGNARGFNPLIPGDNDFTVGVEETVMRGMSDFALVTLPHSMLPVGSRSRRLAVRFLKSGRFRDSQSRDH